MSKRAIFISFPLLLIVAVYFLGPAPEKQKWNVSMPVVPQQALELEKYISESESRHNVKPDNEARIIWNDSAKTKTEYVVVYLHGFSASQEEGDPIHTDFAKTFGCNLYLARLADHGIDTTEQLLYFTGDRFWESAKEALAIGKAMGEKVILMSTSTGGTMGLMLAAEYPQDVFALINMSPNIAINNPTAFLLNNPWGLQIARQVLGGNYSVNPDEGPHSQYWNHKYRVEAIIQLQELVEDRMTKETFQRVSCPSLTMYYYKNEKEQDPTVKVSAMIKMNKMLSTPDDRKVMVPIPGAGGHVIGSYLVSKDINAVREAAFNFAEQNLMMKRVTPSL
jgi:pimeloyl-ACP methyl ester carboxylesterase